MKKQDYDEKLVKMLSNDETNENLKRDPTAKTEKLLNKFISRLLDNQKITQGECFNLKSSDAQAPRLHGQPKVHKPDIPLRPIVSFIGSPTYALSKKIVKILAPLVGNTESHVRNSSDFVESITNLLLEDDEILVSFDIVSLFTNIPTTLAVEIAKKRLTECNDVQAHTNW